MEIPDLVRSIDLPKTNIADTAWDKAVRRRRIRGIAGTASVALVVAAIIIGSQFNHPQRTSPTPIDRPTTAPSMPALTSPEVKDRLLNAARLEPEEVQNLSQNPVERAAFVTTDAQDQTRVLVYGNDAAWRVVDGINIELTHDDDGYTSSPLRTTSLNPGSTRLAMAQPGALIVVDLTTGRSRRYEAGEEDNTYAIWADEGHVLVAGETASTGILVDLRSGGAQATSFGPYTAFLDDGTALTWGRPQAPQEMDAKRSSIRFSSGETVETPMNNVAGLHIAPPLVADDVLVGLYAKLFADLDEDFETALYNGVVVVDRRTGAPLALQQTTTAKGDTTLLLGLEGDSILFAVPVLGSGQSISERRTVILSWNWQQGELTTIVSLPGAPISWGSEFEFPRR